MFSSEVLPAPLGPMIDTMLPRGTSSDTPCDATTPPNFFDTPSTTSWLSPSAATSRRADVPAMTPPYSRSCFAYRCRHHAGSDGRRQQIRLDLARFTKELRHAAPHRLPDLRPRPHVRLHRPRPDDAHLHLARRVRRGRHSPPGGTARPLRHQGDLLHPGPH